MDLALARKAGQELHNDYVITAGPEFGSLRSFFRAAVRALVCAYIDYPLPGSRGRNTSFSCSPIRPNLNDTPVSTGRNSPVDQPEGIPVMSMPPPLTFTSSTPTVPVVQRPMRSLTPNNRSLSFLQTVPCEDVQVHNFQHRGAVASISIASTDLLLHVGPLPMEQLILHDSPPPPPVSQLAANPWTHRSLNRLPVQWWKCLFIRSPQAVSGARWGQSHVSVLAQVIVDNPPPPGSGGQSVLVVSQSHSRGSNSRHYLVHNVPDQCIRWSTVKVASNKLV